MGPDAADVGENVAYSHPTRLAAARHPPHEGEGGRLPAGAVGPDEADLFALLDDGGGLGSAT